MRKIKTKNSEAKKQRRNNTLIGLLLIFVMFFSVVGYGFMGQNEEQEDRKIDYKGHTFLRAGDYWVTSIGSYQFGFRNNPSELEDSDEEVKYLNSYSNKPLYLLSGNQEAELALRINLNQVAQRIQYACLDEETCEGDFPVKDCGGDNFIIIKEENISKIEQDGTCVILQGPVKNITKITETFLLKTIGIK